MLFIIPIIVNLGFPVVSFQMESAADENLESSTVSADVVVQENHDSSASDIPNHIQMENQHNFSEEEVRGTLETSASTGSFWQDWEKLRSILSFHIKQVLSEYPEAKMTNEEQISSLGETFEELAKRLDDAIHSFNEGPPFTLQRICEILLSARSIYPKLSKFSFALQKNLLVTSTLTISNGPHLPATEQTSNGTHEDSGNAQPLASSLENGVVPAVVDRDEIMTEVEETEVDDSMTIDMVDTIEDIVRSTDANPTSAADS